MKPLKIAVIFSILAMMLSACAGSTQIDLAGATWLLTAFDEKSPIEGTQPTIQFDNGQVSGNTGCNLFSGSFQLNGDEISFSSLAWTERGCVDPEGVMEQERLYMELLGAARHFELEDDELRIFTDSQAILTFEKHVDVPTASSLSTPTSPTSTAEMVATAGTLTIEPPAGFKEYQASSIGVSIYIPESWMVTDVVEG